VKSDETHEEEATMPHDDLEAEMRALIAKYKESIAKYKEMTEQTLITVLQVKAAAAHEPALLHIYQAAVRKEQELIDILKAIEGSVANFRL